MAQCVISAVADTDDPDVPIVAACVVHAHWAPCPHWGEPAIPVPLHGLGDDRDELLRTWWVRTHRQRPLVLHHEVDGMTAEDHATGATDTSCRCGAELLPAEEAPVG